MFFPVFLKLPTPMKFFSLRPVLADLARQFPEPPRALRLARMLIPLAIITGLAVEPMLRWLLRNIGAGA